MKKQIVLIVAAALVLPLVGCKSPVPGTHISGQLGGKPFEFNSPKQMSLSGFLLRHTSGTNTFTLSISNMVSTNDPQVISKAYAGQAAVEKVRWEGMNNFAKKVIEGAADGASPIP